MSLKNYSTSISVDKTISEIERILSTHGASDIWKQYDGVGNVVCLNFAVNTEFGKMPFRLPMDAQKVSQILRNEKRAGKVSLSRRESEDIDHARKVGWRIIKDWIDSQLALVEVNLVKVEQVFLPYAYDPVKNQTLYEAIKERKFAGMLMAPEQKQEGEMSDGWLDCEAFRKAENLDVEHCTSCHSDDEDGYDLLICITGKAYVCCAVNEAYQEKQKKQE